MNLRSRLNLNKKVYDDNTRIIVVELGGKIIGFTVDEVNEVLRIPRNITEAPPEIVAGINSKYITAIGKLDDRLLILLDLNKIVSVEEEAETFSIAS
jgi:purine-binding chemotaxis protein CheW